MSTPDQTPEQPEPYTRQSPQSPLENEGWGTSDPANPFTEETRTVPWFRRPATLIGGAAVAVVVIVGLVIALLVTGKDAGSTEAGSTAATATSSAAAFSDAHDELTYTDRRFLGGSALPSDDMPQTRSFSIRLTTSVASWNRAVGPRSRPR